MKKKLLYIGHDFHNKTKSTSFLQELLKEKYDVETYSIDPFKKNSFNSYDFQLAGKYDVVVVFQIIREAEQLLKKLKYKHAVYFPMYDSCLEMNPSFWLKLKDFNIINFSKTLHTKLLNLGLSSYYLQYFPKPFDIKDYGSEDSVFFWQRITRLNINTLNKVFSNQEIKHIHIHKSIDPFHDFIVPSGKIKDKITYSTWYDNKEDMHKDVISSAFYMASREYEGIGMSFLEAMSMGRCVVSPNNPTMNEYIKDGETGFLYDLNNPGPVDFRNVRQIQQNARIFIQEGYKRWEKEKYNIFDWLEADSKLNEKLYKKKMREYGFSSKEYLLFNTLKILVYKDIGEEKLWCLFSMIPLLSVRIFPNEKIWYILGFLKIWRVKYA